MPPGFTKLQHQKVISGFRYEDDILVASKVVCSTCLDKLVQNIYGHRINIDEQNDHMRVDHDTITQKLSR
eukprot:2944201-Karenia_brevis.AAC.1